MASFMMEYELMTTVNHLQPYASNMVADLRNWEKSLSPARQLRESIESLLNRTDLADQHKISSINGFVLKFRRNLPTDHPYYHNVVN